jgi:hypothetical protein
LDDFAKATAAGTPVAIGGVSYRVAKFGPRSYGDLNAWLKAQKPDPRTLAKELCAGLSDAVAIEIWRDLKDEAQDWPITVDTYQGNMLLTTTSEGAAQVVWVTLRQYQPDVTLQRAAEIARDMTVEEVGLLIRAALPEPTHDPKAERISSPTGEIPTSR